MEIENEEADINSMPLSDWEHTVNSGPLKIEEIEREHMHTDDGRIPHVPFGFENSTWVEFKSKIKEGDRILAYCSENKDWEKGFGREGYLLVRGDMIVADQMTRMN